MADFATASVLLLDARVVTEGAGLGDAESAVLLVAWLEDHDLALAQDREVARGRSPGRASSTVAADVAAGPAGGDVTVGESDSRARRQIVGFIHVERGICDRRPVCGRFDVADVAALGMQAVAVGLGGTARVVGAAVRRASAVAPVAPARSRASPGEVDETVDVASLDEIDGPVGEHGGGMARRAVGRWLVRRGRVAMAHRALDGERRGRGRVGVRPGERNGVLAVAIDVGACRGGAARGGCVRRDGPPGAGKGAEHDVLVPVRGAHRRVALAAGEPGVGPVVLGMARVSRALRDRHVRREGRTRRKRPPEERQERREAEACARELRGSHLKPTQSRCGAHQWHPKHCEVNLPCTFATPLACMAALAALIETPTVVPPTTALIASGWQVSHFRAAVSQEKP